jgi:predicted TIM-barrel fold metal-dependent hydrolase
MLPPDLKLISVDDHVVEPPHLWTERLPRKYRDVGPRVVEGADGREAWHYEDIVAPVEIGMVRTRPGLDRESFPNGVRFDEMRPGCFDPKERLVDMDTDGTWAQLAFPTFARFAGHRFIEGQDRELSALCTQAYNDWVLEEWCAASPERLLPMAVLPLWDVERSIAEVQRVVAAGAKAIAFSENPTYLGLPSVHRSEHWDPLWAAVQDADVPVCMHIGSGTKLMSSSDEMPWPAVVALDGVGTMMNCVDWLYSGVFDRFPRLRVILSEGGAGWVPYVLERCEKVFDIHRPRIAAETRPAETFARHMYVCIVTDDYALANLDLIGVDNILWESDYPHNDSMWPDSRTVYEQSTQHLDAATITKIGETNARRVLGL